VKKSRHLLIGLGVMLVLVLAVSLTFASDAAPSQEPEGSPFFEATLQRAVDELDGKVNPSGVGQARQPEPTQHYTTNPNLWPECQFGYTRDVVQWPSCHYTSDPAAPGCDTPWPTQDYTWDANLWQECDPTGVGITQDPTTFWCNPTWTHDPQWGPQCGDPAYTRDTIAWPWCNPRYTWDPTQWPDACFSQPPFYTESPDMWPECNPDEYTMDPSRWRQCHYTSDPRDERCVPAAPTWDYTSSPAIWPECDPLFTSMPNAFPCEDPRYTQEAAIWPWCQIGPIAYTGDPYMWPLCHFTSDPQTPQCVEPYPTKDYTRDANLWPECGQANYTQEPGTWPWCQPAEYTTNVQAWPWCAPNWTWDPETWPECQPGYTNDANVWPECEVVPRYTQEPSIWPECQFYTADARIWPQCHYTSDPNAANCNGTWFPTKDYTTDTQLWPECELPVSYTSDPQAWPECHYTSDPAIWPECEPQEELGDLGDAPDDTNHAGAAMTAYPAVVAKYPTVFDPATGLPQGPKHWSPRADAWLGPWVTVENDADLMPDEDGLTNIDPPADLPDRDGADDGLLYPVNLPDCQLTVISYTVTVSPGAMIMPRYVNVWFDWNRDGDWQDIFTCASGLQAAEWAVQDQVINLGPGTYVLQTPYLLPYNPTPNDPLWMRITLSEQPAPVIPGANLADGRGPANGYQYGETEDYYLWSEPEPDYDIYIKDNDTDDGSVPSSSPWWKSPDIWVRNDGDCTNTTHENPMPGTTATICVRVRNRMTTAVDNIKVNVYWTSAALGIWWPGSWSYVNSFTIASLAGGSSTVQSVPWNVPYIAGHACLLARADAPHDPLGSGPDTTLPVDLVPNNNNIAQKNMNIVDFPEITTCGFYTTTVYTETVYFDAVNTKNSITTVGIVFESSDFPLGSGTMVVEPGSLWGRWTTLTNFNQLVNTLEPTAFPATMGGIQMAPYETARMTVTVAAEIDERFTIDIEERSGGKAVGGIEYMRNLPHCVYLPVVLKSWSP
jgi:hypothetical protein